MPLDDTKRELSIIIPENNLRLPDALTVSHGPAALLARFVLAGDIAVRQWGIHLRIRHDFDALQDVNRRAVADGTCVPTPMMFNPRHSDLRPDNSYWLSGESESGEIVLTGAFRVFDWRHSALADEAGIFFCNAEGQPHRCIVTAPAASEIGGIVFWGGSLWIRPDYRRRHLSEIVGRLGRAFAAATWPVDWMMCLVVPTLADKGIAHGYGYKHLSRSIMFPACHLGDLEMVVAYLSVDEAYADFAGFLSSGLSDPKYFDNFASSSRRAENIVTSTSSEPVVHGSISLS
jgi:hypothetical protein